MRNSQIRIWLSIVVIVVSAVGSAWAQQPSYRTAISMEAYVQEVLDRNPQVSTRRAGRDASSFKVPQAGSLPDPVVGLSIMNLPLDSFRFNQMDMTMKILSISQGFPPPGVLKARTTLAESEVELATSRINFILESLARQAKLLYLNLYFVERSLEIVRENQALLDQFIRISEIRYRTGSGIQQDVLKARLEHSRLTEREIYLQTQHEVLLSAMNALRDRPAEEPIIVEDLTVTEPELPRKEYLSRTALKYNPALQLAVMELEQSKAALELTDRLLLPGWNAALSYAQRDGARKDLVSASVMVQVPFFAGRKQRRAVDEYSARVRETEYRVKVEELKIKADIGALLSELEKTLQLISLYSSAILPEAEGVLTSALSGYQVGQVDFLTLLSAQRTLLNYQLESIRIVTDYHRRLAELESVAGAPIQMTGVKP